MYVNDEDLPSDYISGQMKELKPSYPGSGEEKFWSAKVLNFKTSDGVIDFVELLQAQDMTIDAYSMAMIDSGTSVMYIPPMLIQEVGVAYGTKDACKDLVNVSVVFEFETVDGDVASVKIPLCGNSASFNPAPVGCPTPWVLGVLFYKYAVIRHDFATETVSIGDITNTDAKMTSDFPAELCSASLDAQADSEAQISGTGTSKLAE